MENLTDNNFEETIINSKLPVLVDFWAEWCPPCKKLTPVLGKVAEDYKEKLTIYKVNVDDNPILSQTFKIEVIPTVVLFKNKEAIAGFTGYREEENIKEWLDKNL
jgi:thioredoxin 1